NPISADVHRLHEEHHGSRTRPTCDEDHILVRSIEGYSKVFIIVVNALDEYLEEPCCVLLGHLFALGSAVKLMVTSRPHTSIYPINSFDTLEIRATEADLRNYLDGRIRKSYRLSKHIANAPDLREAIEARIVHCYDGMYVLPRLETSHRQGHPRLFKHCRRTSAVPTTKLCTGSTEEDKDLAWLVLSWVANAQRPLKPFDLGVALAVEENTTKVDPESVLDTETMLSVCAGLV
ncbi:hypothetical protein K438DRAFT_1418015, partial [Mycena galopus ATCC 62051]